MGAHAMLERLLQSGLDMLQGQGAAKAQPMGGANPPNGASQSRPVGMGATAGPGLQWGQIVTGGAVGGALGLLMGNRKARKLGGKYAGKVLKYGSVAALGLAAYKTYEHWQAKQAQPNSNAAQPMQGQNQAQAQPHGHGPVYAQPALASDNPWVAHSMPALAAPHESAHSRTVLDTHSRVMLTAMVAAAKADGHVDAHERSLVEAEIRRLGMDPQDTAWLEQELQRPLDPAEVARAAQGPVQAAELYLASVLMADDTSFMERAYLDELARQLKLPDGLKHDLEAQAQAA